MSPFAKKLPFPFTELHAAIVLLIFHFVGIVGMTSKYSSFFVALTPLNLVLSIFILLAFHPKYDSRFWLFSTITILTGIGVEWIGVHTGWLFGSYFYSGVFGWRIDGIPILIGINWLMLTIICGEIAQSIIKNKTLKTLTASFLMVVLDYLIEPVAIRYNFWQWTSITIPWTNYLTWFVISIPLQYFYHWSRRGNNPLAKWLFLVQVLFFIALQIK